MATAIPGNSEDSARLVQAAKEAGWRVHRSKNGHWIARSPNGEEPASFGWSPDIYGKEARARMNRLTRWIEQVTQPDPAPAPEPVAEPVAEPEVRSSVRLTSPDGKVRVVQQNLADGRVLFSCVECGWVGVSRRSTAQHYGTTHSDTPMTKRWTKRKSRPTLDKAPEEPTPSDPVLDQIRRLVQTADEHEMEVRNKALVAENEQLRKELQAMQAERAALRDLLSSE